MTRYQGWQREETLTFVRKSFYSVNCPKDVSHMQVIRVYDTLAGPRQGNIPTSASRADNIVSQSRQQQNARLATSTLYSEVNESALIAERRTVNSLLEPITIQLLVIVHVETSRYNTLL